MQLAAVNHSASMGETIAGMNLSTLLEAFITLEDRWDRKIYGLTLDSRRVRAGDVFCACPGNQTDGSQFIQQAIDGGAVAVLCHTDQPKAYSEQHQAAPLIYIPQLSEQLGPLAARFYHEPSTHMNIVGFTGTNGKTSCSHFLAHCLQSLDKSCALLGTLGAGFPDQLRPATHTTPDALLVQQLLAEMLGQGAETVAMEVSSHGLDQHRVDGVAFDIAVFTNFTQDHLDYHHDMESYWQAKLKLFNRPGLRYGVVNLDDPYGQRLLQEAPKTVEFIGYATADVKTDIPLLRADNIRCNGKGVSAHVTGPWGDGMMRSPFLGRFNISNLLTVLAVLSLFEVPFAKALKLIAGLPTITGRLQTFGGGKQPLVVVDYAHTPDALEKTLVTLREHCNAKLWCVFGCGGDRDLEKRPKMGQVAERYSDQLIITDDNPRNEDPHAIVADIVAGLLCPWAAEIEHDRGAAIAHAIDCAAAGDIVLIAGKGHEAYQLIGKDRLPFNDVDEVNRQLRLRQ